MSNQKPLKSDLNHASRLPDIFESAPTLTSFNTDWSNIILEAFCLPPGNTPEFSLAHYVISINVGPRVLANQFIESKCQKAIFFQGTLVICPLYSDHFFCWDSTLQMISLSLKPELLRLSAMELLGKDCVELIPKFGFQDELIHQLGLAMYTELCSQGSSSRLYSDTLANALTVHLLRNYTTQKYQTPNYNGGFAQHKLRLVIDYINDNLERELSLKELAALTQMSQYHFCRAFKQTIGFSPHQYLIQQRVERAKQLLQKEGMSIGAVANACGFTHQSHFHRHFKRLTGVTPKTFLNS